MKSSQNKPKEKDTNNIRDIIGIGSQIAGNIAGSAVGYFFADLPGAIAGGATGPIITVAFERLASEFKNRVLGKREEIRIGATMAFAIDKLRENMDNGKKIRDDEFLIMQIVIGRRLKK